VARTKCIGIREQLTSLISTRELNRFARWSGAVKRRRKVNAMALFWTVVLGFTAGGERSLAGLRRAYQKSTGTRLVPSAFYDRFNAPMAEFFRTVAGVLLERLETNSPKLSGVLHGFRDVLVADSTLVRLHEMLQGRFPACRTNHTKAAAKLHVVMSVHGEGLKSVRVTEGRQHDSPILKVGRWVKDRLLLFDLGYFRYGLFERIDAHGGYFISRLKERTNPLITAVLAESCPQGVNLVGQRLRDVVGRLRRREFDVEVEVEFRRREYAGCRSSARKRLRLAGVRDATTGSYHLYITNIPVKRLTASQVAAVYAGRWQIELMFREMKSRYGLEEVPSRKPHIVDTLLYATVLTLLVSRRLLSAVREKMKGAKRTIPEERWAALFSSVAPAILDVLLAPDKIARSLSKWLERMLLHEAFDPNVSRRLLIARVQNGVMS
jgi:IS4 transposase